MRPKHITYTIAASDPDGVCAPQTAAGAGALVIAGALATGGVATFAIPRHVMLVCAGDESGVIFTVTGTDRFGNALTEDITGVNATSAKGTKNFKTVAAVTIDAALAGNVTLGSANSLETAWFPLSPRNETYTFGINHRKPWRQMC